MADPAYIDPATGVLLDGEAWVAIQSQVAATTEATVTFTSTDDGQVGDFSQYMDLCIVVYCQQDQDDESALMYVVLNGESSNGYTTQWMRVTNAGTPNAQQLNNTNRLYGVYTSGDRDPTTPQPYLFSASIWDFYDINSGKALIYSAKGANNQRGASGEGPVMRIAGLLDHAGPLTSIQFYRASIGFSAGSRFDLFGILPRMVAP